nr:MAG TPA: hypothetical protein [Bacteriophage sp.]
MISRIICSLPSYLWISSTPLEVIAEPISRVFSLRRLSRYSKMSSYMPILLFFLS